jgi:nitronate monooxygenase
MNIKNLQIPIIQAPIEATAELTVSVSETGGMGSLQGTWIKPEIAAQLVDSVVSKTNNPFFVNFVLSFEPHSFDAVIEAGAPVITFSWGHAPELIDRAHHNNVAVGVQVGTAEGARIALSHGADFLICQGVEAGGHVQSTTVLATLLPQVLSVAGDVPVFAAGGLATGADIAWALRVGASGAMLGTRFVATQESEAHQHYKEMIVTSSGSDSVYTLCFDGGWSQVAHRVLRNATLNMWEDAGCPVVGKRPREGDIVARGKNGYLLKRYDHDTPTRSINEGDVSDWCLYAGTSCGSVNDIPIASELVLRLWQDCKSAQ